ncbi:MAG TPA: hypothetical protein VFK41_08760 [Nocardioidaceae bacterium]|nr:hypothetical protein [Nocardioidaceae bacterium]
MFQSKTSTLRRLAIGMTLGGASIAALAVPAHGDSLTRIDEEYWGVDCVYSLGAGDTVFLFGSGTTDGAEGGVGAFIENADGQIIAEGWTPDFTFGDVFTTSIDLGGTTFSLAADVQAGATESMPVRERSGNSWTKGTTTETLLDVTATAATYGATQVDLTSGGCGGSINGFDVVTTNPAAQIYTDSGDLESEICTVDGLADGQVRVSGILPQAYVEVVLDHGGENVEKAQGEITLQQGSGSLTTDVVDYFTGEVRTTATIGLELERVGTKTRDTWSEEGIVERRTFTTYHETITVEFADGRSGTATCSGIATTTQVRIEPGH